MNTFWNLYTAGFIGIIAALQMGSNCLANCSFYLLGCHTSIPSVVPTSWSYIQNNLKSKHSSNTCKIASLHGLSHANLHSGFPFCMVGLHSHFMKWHSGIAECILHFRLHVCVLNLKNEIWTFILLYNWAQQNSVWLIKIPNFLLTFFKFQQNFLTFHDFSWHFLSYPDCP